MSGTSATIESVVIDDSFASFKPKTLERWFFKYKDSSVFLKSIEGLDNIDTTNAINMRAIFSGNKDLTKIEGLKD